MNDKLNKLKMLVDEFDGIHCVIGNEYCSCYDDGYIDEFYINSISENNIEIYHNKKTYIYTSFEEMINEKIFEDKSIKNLINNIYMVK